MRFQAILDQVVDQIGSTTVENENGWIRGGYWTKTANPFAYDMFAEQTDQGRWPRRVLPCSFHRSLTYLEWVDEREEVRGIRNYTCLTGVAAKLAEKNEVHIEEAIEVVAYIQKKIAEEEVWTSTEMELRRFIETWEEEWDEEWDAALRQVRSECSVLGGGLVTRSDGWLQVNSDDPTIERCDPSDDPTGAYAGAYLELIDIVTGDWFTNEEVTAKRAKRRGGRDMQQSLLDFLKKYGGPVGSAVKDTYEGYADLSIMEKKYGRLTGNTETSIASLILSDSTPTVYRVSNSDLIADGTFLGLALCCYQSLEDDDGWAEYQPRLERFMHSTTAESMFEYASELPMPLTARNPFTFRCEENQWDERFSPPSRRLDSREVVREFLDRLMQHCPRGIKTISQTSRYNPDRGRYMDYDFPTLTSFLWFQFHKDMEAKNPKRICPTCYRSFIRERPNKMHCSKTCRVNSAGRTRDQKPERKRTKAERMAELRSAGATRKLDSKGVPAGSV